MMDFYMYYSLEELVELQNSYTDFDYDVISRIMYFVDLEDEWNAADEENGYKVIEKCAEILENEYELNLKITSD